MASIRKREGRDRPWQVRWRDPDGRMRSKAFRRKVDADAHRAQVEHEMHRGEYRDPDAGKVTVREYAEQWRTAQVHRASTAGKVESVLRLHCYPTLGDVQLRRVTPSVVQQWVKTLTVDLSPSTVAVVHGVVASVFKAAVRDRLITSSPCDGTKLPEREDVTVVPLETDQVLALVAELPDRWRALVTLGAAAGPRVSEAVGLTVDRTGLMPPSPRPTLRVDRQLVADTDGFHLGPPKRKASVRDVPLPRVAVDALAAHLAAYPPVERPMRVRDAAGRDRVETVSLVFTDDRGEPIRRNALSRVWRPAVAAAGLDPDEVTYHSLRHYYASLLIRHGESVKVVQARLGHATAAETLDTYSHLWADNEDRTREAVDRVLGPASRGPSVAQEGQ